MTTNGAGDDRLADVLRAIELRLVALDVRLERLDAAHQRGLLAVERRLGAIEDGLADWAAHYWAHEDHPPRPA